METTQQAPQVVVLQNPLASVAPVAQLRPAVADSALVAPAVVAHPLPLQLVHPHQLLVVVHSHLVVQRQAVRVVAVVASPLAVAVQRRRRRRPQVRVVALVASVVELLRSQQQARLHLHLPQVVVVSPLVVVRSQRRQVQRLRRQQQAAASPLAVAQRSQRQVRRRPQLHPRQAVVVSPLAVVVQQSQQQVRRHQQHPRQAVASPLAAVRSQQRQQVRRPQHPRQAVASPLAVVRNPRLLQRRARQHRAHLQQVQVVASPLAVPQRSQRRLHPRPARPLPQPVASPLAVVRNQLPLQRRPRLQHHRHLQQAVASPLAVRRRNPRLPLRPVLRLRVPPLPQPVASPLVVPLPRRTKERRVLLPHRLVSPWVATRQLRHPRHPVGHRLRRAKVASPSAVSRPRPPLRSPVQQQQRQQSQ